MTYSVAILAGGRATRLYPLTVDLPKSLVPINNYPFIGLQLNQLAKSGVGKVILCLGHKASEIIEFVGDGTAFGLEVQYSVEDSPLGTGGALRNAMKYLDEYFGILYGDSYLQIDYVDVFKNFLNSEKLGLMTIYKNNNQYDSSNAGFDSYGNLRYSKYNSNKEMIYIDYGFSVLRKVAFENYLELSSFDLSVLLEELSINNQLEAYEAQNRFYEIGTFKGIFELEQFLLGRK